MWGLNGDLSIRTPMLYHQTTALPLVFIGLFSKDLSCRRCCKHIRDITTSVRMYLEPHARLRFIFFFLFFSIAFLLLNHVRLRARMGNRFKPASSFFHLRCNAVALYHLFILSPCFPATFGSTGASRTIILLGQSWPSC